MQKLNIIHVDQHTGERQVVGEDVSHVIAMDEIRYDGVDTLQLQAMTNNGEWVDLYKERISELFEDQNPANLRFPVVIKLVLRGHTFFGSLAKRAWLQSPSPEQDKISTP